MTIKRGSFKSGSILTALSALLFIFTFEPAFSEVEQYEYVIITSQALEAANGEYTFQDLIESKKAKGLTARIFTVEYIDQSYPGRRPDGGTDLPTKIREFITDCYAYHGTKYVLLGGNGYVIPVRVFDFWMEYGGYNHYSISGDIYYSNLDGDFDMDHDGLYGETVEYYLVPGGTISTGQIKHEDEMDWSMEVLVGRCMATNSEEISNFVRKTLAYDNAVSGPFERVCEICERYPYDINSSIRNVANTFSQNLTHTKYANSFSIREFNDYRDPFHPYQVINMINKGVNIINHAASNSGREGLFVEHDSYYGRCMKIFPEQYPKLNNEFPFFLYSLQRICGQGDRHYADLLTTMRYGAFAVMATYDYSGSSAICNWFWIAAQYHNKRRIGEALKYGKLYAQLDCVRNPSNRMSFIAVRLYGDPEIELKWPKES